MTNKTDRIKHIADRNSDLDKRKECLEEYLLCFDLSEETEQALANWRRRWDPRSTLDIRKIADAFQKSIETTR